MFSTDFVKKNLEKLIVNLQETFIGMILVILLILLEKKQDIQGGHKREFLLFLQLETMFLKPIRTLNQTIYQVTCRPHVNRGLINELILLYNNILAMKINM